MQKATSQSSAFHKLKYSKEKLKALFVIHVKEIFALCRKSYWIET